MKAKSAALWVAASVLSAPAWSQPYGPGMMGWDGGGWGWGFGLMHVLWWVFLVVGVVALVRWTGPRHYHHGGGEDRALSILRERYARGEIDKAEFEDRKRDLKG